jgi:hypothetical protein
MTSLNLMPQQFNVRINPSKSDVSREWDNSRRGEPNLPEGGELGEAGTGLRNRYGTRVVGVSASCLISFISHFISRMKMKR